jgi:hypothetical protein
MATKTSTLIALRLVGIERSAAHALEIFQRKPELGQHFLVRDALATVELTTSGLSAKWRRAWRPPTEASF